MNLESATPSQREAILTEAEDVLCVAGPGSGKTATLIARIERLRGDGAPLESMAAITFTNAGANEIARRMPRTEACGDCDPCIGGRPDQCAVDPAKVLPLGFVGTLHAFALRMLKEHGAPFGYGDRISIISPESAADLLASKAKSLACKSSMKELLTLKAKGRAPRGERMDLAATVVASFLDDLKEAGVVDYDVLLQEFLRALTEETTDALGFAQTIRDRFWHLFVDEVQDSAPIDWAIYRALGIRWSFYVGDPDQAIYGFRGGRVREMVNHAEEPDVEVVNMEENFRSRAEICKMAQGLIAHNKLRIPKEMISRVPGEGVIRFAPVFQTAGEEIAAVARTIKGLAVCAEGTGEANPTIAILARTNDIASGFKKTLPTCGIKVVETKRADLPRDWGMARAFVELLSNPDNDALAFFYLVAMNEKHGYGPAHARQMAHAARRDASAAGTSLNGAILKFGRITKPASAIAALRDSGVSREAQEIAAEKFRELAPGATVLELALALAEVREYSKEEDGDGVRVLTMHGAKGREFDVVFVVGFEDEAIPGRAAKVSDEAIEEERRLAYVSVTRAKRAIYISGCEARVTPWGQMVKRTPSRFLAELKEAAP